MKQIVTLVVLLSFMFTTTGCASLDSSIYQARRYCEDLFKDKGLDTSKEKSKWNKREYVKCVSNTANANENNRAANATYAEVITLWAVMTVSTIIGIATGGGRR